MKQALTISGLLAVIALSYLTAASQTPMFAEQLSFFGDRVDAVRQIASVNKSEELEKERATRQAAEREKEQAAKEAAATEEPTAQAESVPDEVDLDFLQDCFFAEIAQNGNCAPADLNDDGYVNAVDLGIFKGEQADPGITAEPVKLDFSANNDDITRGESVTLTWRAGNADTCTASEDWSGTKPLNGSETVSPTTDSVYRLTCSNDDNSDSQRVSVTVTDADPDPVPDPTFTPGDTIEVNTGNGSLLNVRATPNGSQVGQQPDGAYGDIVAGPTVAAANTWYNVNFDTGVDGWVAEDFLVAGERPDVATTCVAFAYTAWGSCQSDGSQTRDIAQSFPAGCEGGTPVLTQSCVYVPPNPGSSDWEARASAPGVLMATRFDTEEEVLNWVSQDSSAGNLSWETSEKASGMGALRFDILKTDAQSSGNWRRWLSDDQREFNIGDTYYVQFRQYMPEYLLTHDFLNGGGWKQAIFSRHALDMNGEAQAQPAGSYQNNHIVLQNTSLRGMPQMYGSGRGNPNNGTNPPIQGRWPTACRPAGDFIWQPAVDNGPNPLTGLSPDGDAWTGCEQDRARYGGLYGPWSDGAYPTGQADPLTGGFVYHPDEWLTYLVEVTVGGYPEPSGVKLWAAREGQDYRLLIDEDEVGSGTFVPHNTLWLLPYNTGRDPDLTREDTYTLYDEVIVSTDFIPAPDTAGDDSDTDTNNDPTPVVNLTVSETSVLAGDSVNLSWASLNATSCIANGGWSGTRSISGSETVSPNTTTTYSVTCSGMGGSASDSETVTVTTVLNEFSPGDTIQVNTNDALLNVRSAPNGTVIGQQFDGAYGNVVLGPLSAASLMWYSVNFDSGADGWVAEDFLTLGQRPGGDDPNVSGTCSTAADVDSLPAGHWCEVPGSELELLNPCPGDSCAYSGVSGLGGIMDSWSGGAFDTIRDRLLVWGGGHRGYAGNEIYAFDMNTLDWEQLTELSTDINNARTNTYPDGEPRSRHTYSYIEHLPNIDRLISFGGSGPWRDGGGGFTHELSEFDFTTNSWSYDRTPVPEGGSQIGSHAVYDPVNGVAWYSSINSGSLLQKYDPVIDQWTTYNTRGTGLDTASALDYNRQQLLFVGRQANASPLVFRFDLTSDNISREDIRSLTSGDKFIENSRAPGLQYDPITDQFVGWAGGTSVYTLDPDTYEWDEIEALGGANPGQPNEKGTYGRFRYVPSQNVFVLVNDVEEPVYIYRLSDEGLNQTAIDPVQTSDALASVSVNQMYEIPNTRHDQLANSSGPNEVADFQGGNTSGYKGIYTWSSGAYVSFLSAYVHQGGGHGGWKGNNLDKFDLNTLTWSRITDPTPSAGECDPRGDGTEDGIAPRTGHTRTLFTENPERRSIMRISSPSSYTCVSDGSTRIFAAEFDEDGDFDRWTQYGNNPITGSRSKHAFFNPISGYNYSVSPDSPGTAKVGRWDLSTGGNNGTWLDYGSIGSWSGTNQRALIGYDMSSDIDPVRNDAWIAGSSVYDSTLLKVNLDDPVDNSVDVSSDPNFIATAAAAGCSGFTDVDSPGVVYEPNLDKIVILHTGNTLCAVDPDTFTVTKLPTAANSAVLPAPHSTGIFRRAFYSPEHKGIFVIPNTDENVFFYRTAALQN